MRIGYYRIEGIGVLPALLLAGRLVQTGWFLNPSTAAVSATERPAAIRSSTLRRNSGG